MVCPDGFDNGSSVIAVIRVGAVKAGKMVNGAEVRGRVLSSHFSGEHEHLQVGITGHDKPISLRTPAGTLSNEQLKGGQDVGLSFEKQGAFVFSAG